MISSFVVSVCLSCSGEHISGTTHPNFAKFSVDVTCCRILGDICLATLQHIMFFRFCGSHHPTMTAIVQATQTGCKLKVTHQGQHRKSSVYDCLVNRANVQTLTSNCSVLTASHENFSYTSEHSK